MKRIIILVLVLLPLNGCSDWLELIPPDGLVRNEYWKSKEDLQATLMGAYQRFARLDEVLFYMGEVRGDMLIQDVNTPGYIRNIMNGNIYPDNNLSNWKEFYTIINYCNSVIKYAPLIRDIDPTLSEYQMKGYESEAIFLRSLAYFYLVRTYRNVPMVLEPSESDAVDFYPFAEEEEVILATLKSNLQDAKLFASATYGSHETDLGRATKGAITALLADICLWRFEYEECIAYVEEIEEMDYLVMPPSLWFELFYPGNSLESIFEFQFNGSLDQANSLYDQTYYFRSFLISEKALELLDPEETSSSEFIRGPGTLEPDKRKIWKYCGSAPDGKSLRPNSERDDCNWIVYRMSDVLLMKAEALSQLGRYDEALEIVNSLRAKRQALPVTASYTAENFEDLILGERALELAYEGKRWFDLLRMGRRNDYGRKDKLIEIMIENVPSTQKLMLASKLANPWGWYLPVYENELELNKNLEQNPYYADYSSDD
ncbi:MAG: RagB/SusD family nutrient uptake outer membrane protein [Bacteroidetes bacterium]|nr:RagB/SusD family nutrient uptake outer membrane protein [Bacteroidota bacterium]